MDTALELKIKLEKQEIKDVKEAIPYLETSQLYQSLLEDFDTDLLNLLWRLTQLSEIPFAGENDKVKVWCEKLVEQTFTGDGFSLDATNDYLLVCYNAMITSILVKLNYDDKKPIDAGIQWIIKYQNVKRGELCQWEGRSFKKYGGCMKSTPCYVGLVKSMIALSDYKHSNYYQYTPELEEKLDAGLEYILNQKVYLKLRNNRPISREIDKLTYPFSWKTNVIEILRLLKVNQQLGDSRCIDAQDHLKSKQKKDGFWWAQTSNITRRETWIPFDESRKPGLWISHEIQKLL